MATTAWKHEDIGPNIGCPCRVLGLDPFIVHTHVVGWYVEQAGARRIGRGLLVLAAHSTGTDFLYVGPLLRPLRRILDGASRLLVDPLRPIHIDKGLSNEQRPIGPVEGVAKAIAIKMDQGFDGLAIH